MAVIWLLFLTWFHFLINCYLNGEVLAQIKFCAIGSKSRCERNF